MLDFILISKEEKLHSDWVALHWIATHDLYTRKETRIH
jgi:hypothetical protein